MEVRYVGHEVMTYMNHIDAATGKTLTCEPGGTYTVLPDMPNDGRFIAAETPKKKSKDSDEEPSA